MLKVSEPTNGQRVELDSGQEFQVALSEPRTAGFRWHCKIADPLCTLSNESTEVSGPAPGASSRHVWTFRAAARGKTELIFELSRGWEPAPARTITLRLDVK